MALPLQGYSFALGGTFPGTNQGALQSSITALGGQVVKSVTRHTTCLISTTAHVATRSQKVEAALSLGIAIVGTEWLADCTNTVSKKAFGPYDISPQQSSPAKGKRAASPSISEDSDSAPESDEEEASPKRKKQKAVDSGTPNKADNPEPTIGTGSILRSKDIVVPLDEECDLPNWLVYIDDQDLVLDASLNQSNAGANSNKFYRIQLVRNPGETNYKTWTRWGRVGERGKNALLGDGTLEDALRQYEKKFKEKTGHKWVDRAEDPKKGKYAYVERSYASDSEDGGDVSEVTANEQEPPAQCTLDPLVKSLMELIFNQQYINDTMSQFNYDANRMPLGKQSDATINRGFQTLKELATLLQSSGSDEGNDDTIDLSNRYYSLIPHDFGRRRPPIISNLDILKRELELLESLGDLKEAAQLMKKALRDRDRIHPIDRQFKGLGLEEMTVLDPLGKEYQGLAAYLLNTKGFTHNIMYSIQAIFRIERKGEKDRFKQSRFASVASDRRLLWHGSRTTNFGGILSQGLRIAPPEAPVSGYMFGKGIYLADMSSKSANYCFASASGRQALLLLCEAELGDPLYELTNASYNAGEEAEQRGSCATWGQGQFGPIAWRDAKCIHPSLAGVKMPDTRKTPCVTKVRNTFLLYNEYIAYDIAQVRLRYLFRITT